MHGVVISYGLGDTALLRVASHLDQRSACPFGRIELGPSPQQETEQSIAVDRLWKSSSVREHGTGAGASHRRLLCRQVKRPLACSSAPATGYYTYARAYSCASMGARWPQQDHSAQEYSMAHCAQEYALSSGAHVFFGEPRSWPRPRAHFRRVAPGWTVGE